MDLLAGYGSGSDAASDAEDAQDPLSSGVATDRGGLLANLPPPSTSQASAGDTTLSGMPAPRRSRKPVKFIIPRAAIPDSSDEEDQPKKKKVRPDTRGKRLGDVLPAPKSDSVLGGGLGAGGGTRLLDIGDEDDFKDMPPTGDGVLGGADAYTGGNEEFRLEDDVLPAAEYGAAPAADYSAYDSGPTAAYGTNGAAPAAASYAAPFSAQFGKNGGACGQNGAHAGPEAAPANGEQLLQEAMQADARGAARRNAKDPFANLGVQFKEVKQDKLKYIDPGKKEAANAARTAFGADYEAKLRQEAGALPDKLARRKHQISSLFYQAKMKELEVLETKTQGMKTKAETQAKYGW